MSNSVFTSHIPLQYVEAGQQYSNPLASLFWELEKNKLKLSTGSCKEYLYWLWHYFRENLIILIRLSQVTKQCKGKVGKYHTLTYNTGSHSFLWRNLIKKLAPYKYQFIFTMAESSTLFYRNIWWTGSLHTLGLNLLSVRKIYASRESEWW